MVKSKRIPQTIFGRSLKILGSGASILAQEVGSRVSQAVSNTETFNHLKVKLKQAEELVSTLGQLKGAAMKAGQLLSLEMSDLLPPEVVEILRQLHDNAPPMAFSEVERLLLKELGPERRAQLKDFSPEPIAAASIGQVHAAILNGKKVVIKIQFPGVAKSIDSDLKLLKTLASTFLKLQGKSIDLDDLFSEIRRSLVAEVDYVKEAAALLAYTEAFAGDRRYLIPAVYSDFSTHRVLTMEYVEGERINSWLKGDISQQEREHFAQSILALLVKEFFETGLVQTDPNYGNFLYQKENQRLVLLDFGAVQRYSKKFRQDYKRLLKISMEGDATKIWNQAVRMEFLDTREDQKVQDLFFEIMALSMAMFKDDRQPFDFNDTAYLEAIRTLSIELVRSVNYSAPPRQIIFLNRKLGGMFHLLKDAGCKTDLAQYWQQIMSTEIP